MTILALLGLPVAAAALLALLPGYRAGAAGNIAASGLTFCVAIAVALGERTADALFFVDDLNAYLILLTAFAGFTTSLYSAGYLGHEQRHRQLAPWQIRFYHAMFQAFMATMLLALTANNIGLMWVAVEGATLTTALMVSLYRTKPAIEAAWKYFILCGVGIALALFGTILVYLAAQTAQFHGIEAMAWTELQLRAPRFDGAILDIAFVFLLIGYGTKAGLVPLHAWLPDAHAEGPTPISAVLSGLLLNVALYALLRFKMLLGANPQALATGPLMIALGLLSLLVAGAALYRRRDVKKLFSYSSIEHMGIVTLAFGIGGPVANFAGLLHMAMHALTKSAIFFAVGSLAQSRGSQEIRALSGAVARHPAIGWGLVVAVLAIAGLPPFGIFAAEFMLVTAAVEHMPWLAAAIVVGLLLAFGGLIRHLQSIAFAPAPEGAKDLRVAPPLPLYLHLALVLAAGLYLPPPLVGWLRQIAGMLG
ncbi:MAG: hydrogenase 4 subunit F [Alphaproteobacteria bacterium]|jgi:hydrogenase-4 component F|nr:hydrogenase 4 subunit F [Alphaproteobacteria bacterium]